MEGIPTKQKRRKISRACNHCNKAHITCDSARPCSRCVKKGLQDTCQDAPRKTKKYLADVPALITPQSEQGHSKSQSQSESQTQNSQKSQNGQGKGQIQSQKRGQPPIIPPAIGTANGPFEMDTSQSVRSQNGQGRIPSKQAYAATQFQHSVSAPNYLPHTSSALNENSTLNSPSLFARASQNDGYFQNQDLNHNLNQSPDHSYSHNPLFDKPLHSNISQLRRNEAHHSDVNPLFSNQYENKKPEKKKPNFLSSAADMEYATLSNILQDSFLGFDQTHPFTPSDGTPASSNMSPVISPHATQNVQKSSPQSNSARLSGDGFRENAKGKLKYSGQDFQARQYMTSAEFPPFDAPINQYILGDSMHYKDVRYPEVSEAIARSKLSHPELHISQNSSSALSLAVGFQSSEDSKNLQFKRPEDIYSEIKRPFSYTPGFHKLIAYLRGRFTREKLVKMAESMAVYRPSFIACTNSLRESDLIFMEQCFQRTLLTYDNFIKVSGTPTIVWRRTGEIAYVGQEFTTLTGWTQDQLLGEKPTFIVELLDDESVVEYFHLFSTIAFGDFLGATMTECTLLTPKANVKIRAGCMWTMKRDVFGIPMMIIGNFLPIL